MDIIHGGSSLVSCPTLFLYFHIIVRFVVPFPTQCISLYRTVIANAALRWGVSDVSSCYGATVKKTVGEAHLEIIP